MANRDHLAELELVDQVRDIGGEGADGIWALRLIAFAVAA
jgi:hypothetical protein